jgi:regulator of PEP synthase PpsR (kinase-PPPase family)
MHDDGLHPSGWSQADVLLLGVSRVGKTPTSIYLAVMGWKVANLPLVKDMRPPPELFQIDRRRVVGLTIGLEELIAHRQWRQQQFGHCLGGESYVSARELSEELEAADRLLRRGGFRVIDVTQKPVEAIASEVISSIPKMQLVQEDESETGTGGTHS